MNDDKIKGQWKQLHGKLKAQWGRLTDDDLKIADGNSEYLIGSCRSVTALPGTRQGNNSRISMQGCNGSHREMEYRDFHPA